VVEPYALINSFEGWYVAAYDLSRGRLLHFRLDRIKRAAALNQRFEPREGLNPIADVGGWPRTGTVGGSRSARVLIDAEQARWARERRTVLAELEDGDIVVEITFKGLDFLVREVLKEAGDAIVLEPADARDAVLAAAEKLLAPAS
jgi:predicted DNA-binding transcriptional regulator YafY